MVCVDAIITIADAGNFSLDLFEAKLAYNQLRYADAILLIKCDMVRASHLRSIEEKIRAIRSGARIVRTIRGQVPLPLILGIGLFQSDRYVGDRTQHFDCDHSHLANDGFQTLSFEADRPFAADKFQSFL